MRKLLIGFISTYIGLCPLIAHASSFTKSTTSASDVSCTDCVALGSETTGNYAASSSEAGPATSVAANSVALGTDTTGGYAASTTEGGPATTASALAANGSNCSSHQYPAGVDASGAVEGCEVPSTANITESSNLYYTAARSQAAADNWINYRELTTSFSENVEASDSHAVWMDGTGDYLTIPNHASLNFGTGDFTACGWFKPTDYAGLTRGLMGKDSYNGGAYAGWFLQQNSTGGGATIRFATRSSAGGQGNYLDTTSTASSNNYTMSNGLNDISAWNFVCGVRASNVLKVYSNGVLNATTLAESSATNIDNTVPMKIGKFDEQSPSGVEFLGKVDDVRIWNTALSTGNMDSVYASGRGTSTNVASANLQGWWKMEENTGTTVDDSSANSNIATFVGGTIWVKGKVSNAVNGDMMVYNSGWKPATVSVQSAANTACSTTCSTGTCLIGFQNETGVAVTGVVACSSATADQCLCAG